MLDQRLPRLLRFSAIRQRVEADEPMLRLDRYVGLLGTHRGSPEKMSVVLTWTEDSEPLRRFSDRVSQFGGCALYAARPGSSSPLPIWITE
ncbi:hypothetical protein [Achromobacter denitrificans]|uniref:hypothetical protein n=1 Tax=Achromobacter denitrificans TaxID=32002 RepID=UPI003BA1EE16